MTTKITSVCDGVNLFAISATCLVALSDEWDCHSSFSSNKHDPFFTALFFLSFSWPFGSRPTSQCTLCDFFHVRCDEKGGSLRLSLLSPSCWRVVSIDHYSFGGFLSNVYCILVTYGLHRKNKITTTTSPKSSEAAKLQGLLVTNSGFNPWPKFPMWGRKTEKTFHFANLMDFCHLKDAELARHL